MPAASSWPGTARTHSPLRSMEERGSAAPGPGAPRGRGRAESRSGLPELFCGMDRERESGACGTGQLLAAGMASGPLFMLLQAVLGLFPEASAGVLHVRIRCCPTSSSNSP